MGKKRKARRGSSGRAVLLVAGALGAGVLYQVVREHPVAASLVLLAVVAAGASLGWWWVRRSRTLAQQERAVSVTDAMSGTEFEHYVARLVRASGGGRVTVSGRSGDMGADVIGYAPDGRRLVIQCKRYNAKVGSAEIQRFAGTARHIHRADVPVLVTNNYLTAPAASVARKCQITVVDRDALACWLATLELPIPPRPARQPFRQALRHEPRTPALAHTGRTRRRLVN